MMVFGASVVASKDEGLGGSFRTCVSVGAFCSMSPCCESGIENKNDPETSSEDTQTKPTAVSTLERFDMIFSTRQCCGEIYQFFVSTCISLRQKLQ